VIIENARRKQVKLLLNNNFLARNSSAAELAPAALS